MPAWSDGHNVGSSGDGLSKQTPLATMSIAPAIQM
jgi:hypothetical protein